MQFAHPDYWWLLILVPLLIVFYVAMTRRRQKFLKLLAASSSVSSRMSWGRLVIQMFLKLGFVLFLLLALIGPQWGYQLREVKKKGADIFMLVDVSQSMRAQDIKPSRMERARREIVDLLNVMTGDRIGLIPFKADATVLCPLTTDYQAARSFVNYLTPDLQLTDGTNIFNAVEMALTSFDPGESRSKAIILITDGEAHQGNWQELLDRIEEEGVRLFIIGLGNQKGAPIPDKEGGFKKDAQGKLVISKLDEVSLQKLARSSSGNYVRSVTGDLDLEQIYLSGIKKLVEARELEGEKQKVMIERFQIPLMIALLLLVLAMVIRRSKL